MPEPLKSLAEKLGFAPGDSVYVETTPGWYTVFTDDSGLELEPSLPATHAHLFCARKAELADFLSENDLEQVEKSIWISWPKQGSKQRSDLSENDVREMMLGWPGRPAKQPGWVDTKLASIDADWSGLKFLRRKS